MRGRIADANGASVSGAKVKATNEESSAEFETESDENGVYLLKNLPSGKYRIEVVSPGFSTSVVVNTPVRSSNVTELNFTLNAAGASSVVEVTAEGALINSTSSSISTSQIQDLPLNGRAFSSLYLLSPGVVRSGLRDAYGCRFVRS